MGFLSKIKKSVTARDETKGWTLVDKNGKEVKVGDKIMFHGKQVEVTSLEPPHKPGASGYVSTKEKGSNWVDRYYAKVYDMEYRRDDHKV